jgi:hypothetical protein
MKKRMPGESKKDAIKTLNKKFEAYFLPGDLAFETW